MHFVYEIIALPDGSIRYKILDRGLTAEAAASMLPIHCGANGPARGAAHESVLKDLVRKGLVLNLIQ